MTKFKLLVQTSHAGDNEMLTWKEWREVEAHGAKSAIAAAYMKGGAEDVLAVVAVPMRSWRPQTVRVETKPRLIIGGVKPSEDDA